ncbi:MAG: class I SAM-dependent methyltransferase [Thermoflexaceae bacterium]|mgnify:CR=1 FL=1|nr:class I SAM-dependent methyltransferase [Thermoflexaceae bacterium]
MARDGWFAAIWDWQAHHEGKALRRLRRGAIGDVHGRVLEVGVGVGSNWPYFAGDVEYVGIEPNEAMLERALNHAREEGRSMDLRPLDVQAMPFPDASFDAVVATLTFCSVVDASAGLREIRRVLKPGGEFRFLEHVRARRTVWARLQSLVKPLTRRLGGGCEWDRDTVRAIRDAGFEMSIVRHDRLAFIPIVIGSAMKPGP